MYDHHKPYPTRYTSRDPHSSCPLQRRPARLRYYEQVASNSQGKVKMGTGTLYGSLKRMLDAGLVKESDKCVDLDLDDERRIYCQMTDLGAKALASELERYNRIVSIAQERKLYPKTFVYAS